MNPQENFRPLTLKKIPHCCRHCLFDVVHHWEQQVAENWLQTIGKGSVGNTGKYVSTFWAQEGDMQVSKLSTDA